MTTSLSQIVLILGGWTVVLTGIASFVGNNIINKLKIQWQKSSDEQLQVLKGDIDRKK